MNLRVEFLPDGRAITINDFETHGVLVPRGFIFDGASAPRFFWPAIPPFKNTVEESCVHDWLCEHAKCPEDRLYADRLFKKMLLEDPNINNIRAYIGYIGVRLGALVGIGVRYPHWTDKIKEIILKLKRQVV